MLRWLLLAAVFLVTPVAAGDAADDLAACVIGNAAVRLERWHDPYDAAVEYAWHVCDELADALPPDEPGQDIGNLEGIDEFVSLVLSRLIESVPAGFTLYEPRAEY